MRRLQFTPAQGGLRSVAIPGTGTEQFEENEAGELRKLKSVGVKYRQVPDTSDRQILRIYRQDLHDAPLALAWATGQGEVNFGTQKWTTTPQGTAVQLIHDEDIVEVELYGSFNVELTEDDVAQIVKDYRLLASYFPQYVDIFRVKNAENQFASALVHWLTANMTILEEILAELGFAKELKPMPPWIKRVLQLRKEK